MTHRRPSPPTRTSRPTRSVAQKMGVRAGSRARLVDAPPGVADELGLPGLRWVGAGEEADHLHLFVVTEAGMRTSFAAVAADLAPGGALWVSWPRGRRQGTDLTLREVIAVGYDGGLVESTCLRVDDTWAGLRFTHPRPGRVYANSYGTLPWQRPADRRP